MLRTSSRRDHDTSLQKPMPTCRVLRRREECRCESFEAAVAANTKQYSPDAFVATQALSAKCRPPDVVYDVFLECPFVRIPAIARVRIIESKPHPLGYQRMDRHAAPVLT